MSGKGDVPRPMVVTKEVYDANYKKTFEKSADESTNTSS